MRNTANRIADLEAKVAMNTGRGRVYSVVGGPEGGNPAEFIRSCGYDLDEDHDFIIHHVPMKPSFKGATFSEYPWGWVGGIPARATA